MAPTLPTMSTDEVSKRRCRWLLRQRAFTFWEERDIGEVLQLQSTLPDFLVETPGSTRFFLELKSFEKETVLNKMKARVFSLRHMTLQKRVNRLVADAAKQMQPYVGSGLPIVIALDNWRQISLLLDAHTLRSLFVEPGVVLEIDRTTGETVAGGTQRVDNNSPLKAGRNPHVSAVIAIEHMERFDTIDNIDDFTVERPMRVRIIYNPSATVPLPREVFNTPDDKPLN